MGHSQQQVQVWLVWLIAVLVSLVVPVPGELDTTGMSERVPAVQAGSGVVLNLEPRRELFPWLPGYRWRKWALKAYQQGRQAYRRAWYQYQVAYRLARLAQRGALSLAWVLDRLTQRQLRRYLGPCRCCTRS